MQHYYSPPKQFTERTVTLAGDEHHHATRACRVRVGERIAVTDGCGKRVIARITDIDAVKLNAEIEQDVSCRGELPIPITLALAAINPTRFETAVEKCTELGIRRLLPVKAERCEKNAVGRLKEERLRKIALSSAKQSGRSWIPEIAGPSTLEDVVRKAANGILLVASRQTSKTLGKALATIKDKQNITILIGPEGDFSDAEYAALQGIAIPISLGGLTLRSETAAITAVAITANYFNEQIIS